MSRTMRMIKKYCQNMKSNLRVKSHQENLLSLRQSQNLMFNKGKQNKKQCPKQYPKQLKLSLRLKKERKRMFM